MGDDSVMMVTREQLVRDLARLGLGQGSVVLVHSSLSRLGRVDGGAATVITGLLEAVGQSGTVLFPTLTGSEDYGPTHPPVMDVRHTPCWTGAIPEAARHQQGAVRSLHPTHSVTALGANAKEWATGHERGASPCDEESPYYRLISENGFILLLGGVTQQSNTTLHCLEELSGAPYHLQPDVTDGIVIDAEGGRHVVSNRLHQYGRARDFMKVDGLLDAAGIQRKGPVGQSQSQLIPAGDLAEALLPLLREDPLLLLSDDAREMFSAR